MQKPFLKILYFVIVPLAIIAVIIAGPRVTTDCVLHEANLPNDNSGLDGYLKEQESRFTDIVPDTERTIVWAGEKGVQTPLSILYIHGFTATRQELVPVFDDVARALGANLHYVRLSGHGRTPEAMKDATFNTWVNESWEGYRIAQRIGAKVIVAATSTGCSLALWIAAQKTPELKSIILISPNFAPADKNAELLLLPWGNIICKLFIGDYNQYTPVNDLNARYWTTRYRSEGLLAMMASVKYARELQLETITEPTLWLYTEQDKIVSTDEIRKRYERIGSTRKLLVNLKDAKSHVLAGRAISPEMTEKTETIVLDFLKELE